MHCVQKFQEGKQEKYMKQQENDNSMAVLRPLL